MSLCPCRATTHDTVSKSRISVSVREETLQQQRTNIWSIYTKQAMFDVVSS